VSHTKLNSPLLSSPVVSIRFVRFSKLRVSNGMAALQIKRMAEAQNIERTYDPGDIGEMCQFASALLVLQGTDDVSQADKDIVLPLLQRWKTRYRGVLASETAGRVYGALSGDPSITMMSNMLHNQLENSLNECNLPACYMVRRPTGEDLQQCTK